jgi:hypothetical protein
VKLSPGDKKLIKFVCQKVLMKTKCFSNLAKFGSILADIDLMYPDALEALDKAVLVLSDCVVTGDPDVSHLNLEDRITFFNCALFVDFMECRVKDRYQKAKNGNNLPPPERLKLIASLMEQQKYFGDEMKSALTIASVLLEEPNEQKSFLLLAAEPGASKVLAEWLPADERLVLRKWIQSSMRNACEIDYMKGAVMLVGSEECIAAIKDPVAQSLLKDYGSMLATADVSWLLTGNHGSFFCGACQLLLLAFKFDAIVW